jgi:hypothetical protein
MQPEVASSTCLQHRASGGIMNIWLLLRSYGLESYA